LFTVAASYIVDRGGFEHRAFERYYRDAQKGATEAGTEESGSEVG
jgi:hypothetical protein